MTKHPAIKRAFSYIYEVAQSTTIGEIQQQSYKKRRRAILRRALHDDPLYNAKALEYAACYLPIDEAGNPLWNENQETAYIRALALAAYFADSNMGMPKKKDKEFEKCEEDKEQDKKSKKCEECEKKKKNEELRFKTYYRFGTVMARIVKQKTGVWPGNIKENNSKDNITRKITALLDLEFAESIPEIFGLLQQVSAANERVDFGNLGRTLVYWGNTYNDHSLRCRQGIIKDYFSAYSRNPGNKKSEISKPEFPSGS